MRAQQLVEKLLRQPSASLRGARSLAYLFDMSRSLRAVRLASGPLATFFQQTARLRSANYRLRSGSNRVSNATTSTGYFAHPGLPAGCERWEGGWGSAWKPGVENGLSNNRRRYRHRKDRSSGVDSASGPVPPPG